MRSPVSGRALGECNAIRNRGFGHSGLTYFGAPIFSWRDGSRSGSRLFLSRSRDHAYTSQYGHNQSFPCCPSLQSDHFSHPTRLFTPNLRFVSAQCSVRQSVERPLFLTTRVVCRPTSQVSRAYCYPRPESRAAPELSRLGKACFTSACR